jgi:hypothetical protein
MVECVLVRHVVTGSNPVHSAENSIKKPQNPLKQRFRGLALRQIILKSIVSASFRPQCVYFLLPMVT